MNKNRINFFSHFAFMLSACAIVLLMGGCSGAQQGPKNVVLITMDTTRADYIGAFGAEMSETRALDALASDGAVFNNAHTASTATTPSHTSILTSLHAAQHKVYDNESILSPDILTIQDILKAKGYSTAAFISAVATSKTLGFDQGFDYFDEWFDPALSSAERRADNTTDAAIKWLEGNSDKPFFLWIHYYDPHSAYNPPAELRNDFFAVDDAMAGCGNVVDGKTVHRMRNNKNDNSTKGGAEERQFAVWRRTPDPGGACVLSFADAVPVQKALYASEIKFMDTQIGRLVDWFGKKRLYKNTMFIAVGDHGETLDETGHGMNFRHGTVYEEVLRVPLIIKQAGKHKKGRISNAPVSTIDITPTILDALGIDQPEGNAFSGVSLGEILNGGKGQADRPIYFESSGLDAQGVIHDGLKYVFVYAPSLYFRYSEKKDDEQLFDLHADPAENKNLNTAAGELRFKPLMVLLKAWQEDMAKKANKQPVKIEDEDFRKKLKELGYL